MVLAVLALLAAAQPLTLGRVGPVVHVTRALLHDKAGGSGDTWRTYSLFGVDGEVSAIDLVARQSGPLRVGDLLGLTLLGGNEHDLTPQYGPNNLLSGAVEVRGGLQAVYAVSERVDLGVDGGGCLCAYPDEPRSSLNTWFAHARLRVDWFGLEGGYDHQAPMAGAFALLGPVRASLAFQSSTRSETVWTGLSLDRQFWGGRFALFWQFK